MSLATIVATIVVALFISAIVATAGYYLQTRLRRLEELEGTFYPRRVRSDLPVQEELTRMENERAAYSESVPLPSEETATSIQPMKVRVLDAEPVETLPGIRRRTLAYGERLMVTQFLISQGTELPRHSHPHEQISYVVSGELEMRVGGQSYRLQPGDSLLLPAGMEHSALALQNVVVMDTFSPPREDYKGGR